MKKNIGSDKLNEDFKEFNDSLTTKEFELEYDKIISILKKSFDKDFDKLVKTINQQGLTRISKNIKQIESNREHKIIYQTLSILGAGAGLIFVGIAVESHGARLVYD